MEFSFSKLACFEIPLKIKSEAKEDTNFEAASDFSLSFSLPSSLSRMFLSILYVSRYVVRREKISCESLHASSTGAYLPLRKSVSRTILR